MNFQKTYEFAKGYEFKFRASGFNDVIQKYFFFNYFGNEEFNSTHEQIIVENVKKSLFVIIDYKITPDDEIFFIIGFERTIITLKLSSLSFLRKFLSLFSNLSIYFLSNAKNILSDLVDITTHKEIKKNSFIEQNIDIFKSDMILCSEKKSIEKVWPLISSCIIGYLLIKSYTELNKQRIPFKNMAQIKNSNSFSNIKEEDYIEMQLIGNGSLFSVSLIYCFKNEKLLAIKKKNGISNEFSKLIERERNNYSKINHPFLPKFYGTIENSDVIVIEYINGQTLEYFENMKLINDEKITIIFEILLIFDYLHRNKFVFRDLKPNNLIVDDNKNVILIDFDRMIKIDENISYKEHTVDLYHSFLAPEIYKTGDYSYKSDIYSIGKIIYYIMNENDEINNKKIEEIYRQCIEENSEERPCISMLLLDFYHSFYEHIHIKNLNEIFDEKLYEVVINDPKDLFEIGNYYIEGTKINQDINKAIHYLKLAANENNSKAQFKLGLIYHEGKYVTTDISQAIHYYTLAADQNMSRAQFNLATIYHEGKYVKRDINKALHYYSLSSDQNVAIAQFNMGSIYSNGKYIKCDIDKAIHYFKLAAKNDMPQAQFNLAVIYSDDKYVKRDINRAIHYFEIAAKQNHFKAQFNLGSLYEEGIYIKQNIKKAIHYYTLAAKNGVSEAQYRLGSIYDEGKYIDRDNNKAIFYYRLAAKQNHKLAQYKLGNLYSEVQYSSFDINESIYYYKLALCQGVPQASFNLALIYHQGIYIARIFVPLICIMILNIIFVLLLVVWLVLKVILKGNKDDLTDPLIDIDIPSNLI